MSLAPEELERYSRQLLMAEWSGAAQERLKAGRAVIVGVGALGSPVAAYLAAAGVGRIELVDGDTVELSNLHRQPIYSTPDVGASKAEVAAARLRLLNPDVSVEPTVRELTAGDGRELVAGADVVVDCTDSFESRYAVNDACCAEAIDLVEGGVVAFDGLVLSVRPGVSACYRCAFPSPPPAGTRRSCRNAGVLGAMAGVVGSIQALEALKLLGDVGQPLLDRLLSLDGRDMGQTVVLTSPRPDCPACAQVPAASSSR
ncbi:thiazole biosynthesis adenylyltransferase ThiF [soil metagenome]